MKRAKELGYLESFVTQTFPDTFLTDIWNYLFFQILKKFEYKWDCECKNSKMYNGNTDISKAFKEFFQKFYKDEFLPDSKQLIKDYYKPLELLGEVDEIIGNKDPKLILHIAYNASRGYREFATLLQ